MEDQGRTVSIDEAVAIALGDINGGRVAAGLDVCRRVLAARPDHRDALYLAGIAAQRLGDLPQAETFLARAVAFDGASVDALIAYGEVMRAGRRQAEAQPALRRAYGTGAVILSYLEMDIQYACNLHCRACSHYSNHTIKGGVDFARGAAWMDRWATRLMPQRFRMLGGEPTLNPDLCRFIRHAAAIWPNSRREVVSNGFFLARHPDLYQALAETGTRLNITLHDIDPEYLAKVDPDGIVEAGRRHGFPVGIATATEAEFHRLYRGEGRDMLPFDDHSPGKSWQVCREKECPTIHLGRLWKCPPVAFLNNIDERFGLFEKAEWQPYLQHKGLSSDCTDDEILRYVGAPESVCGMCPTRLVAVRDG